jgi:hypothetical protein
MARAIKQIEQDIAGLENLVREIGQELYSGYGEYLTALGETSRRQLILASYYICTQGYPDRFLDLTLNQRQELQQSLQKLARQAQAKLIEPLQTLEQVHPSADYALDHATVSVSNSSIEESDRSPILLEIQEEMEQNLDSAKTIDLPITLIHPKHLKTPKELLKWQEQLEQLSVEVLQHISHAANRSLQQSGVLARNLPEPILEVATKSGMSAEPNTGHPNILNLIVEAETEEKGAASITHIMAIRLRLSELEFNDPNLTSLRSKIRTLCGRVNQLKQEYQKRQKEKAIAQAEAAWRSSWYEAE